MLQTTKYLIIKSILDFLGSLLGMVLLSPLFAIVSVWIKLDSKGPVFFTQKRVGKDKKLFNIYKFRTMRIDTPKDTPTHMLTNPDAYITKSGKFLRATSLDELPQLINILKLDMSFIGPRPALYNQYDLIKERDALGANAVRPGLSGWAQVHGRDELEISLKAKYDGEYVRNIGLIIDIKCIVQTVLAVVKKDGFKEGANQ